MIGPSQRGGFKLPTIGAVLVVPNTLFNTSATQRMHKAATKEALEDTLLSHWRTRWKRHFKRSNRREYRHRARSRATKGIKKATHRSMTDLVLTRKTEKHMTTRRPAFSTLQGSKASGRTSSSGTSGVTGRLTMTFPFPTNRFKEKATRTDGQRAITPTEMANELSRWTTEDLSEASRKFQLNYARHMNDALRQSPRLRKKYGRIQ